MGSWSPTAAAPLMPSSRKCVKTLWPNSSETHDRCPGPEAHMTSKSGSSAIIFSISGLLKPEMEKMIADDPDLLVMCASGPGQRSWVSEEFGQSVFTHFLLEGMSGAAAVGDHDPIYASDLFNYVEKNVQDWVQYN